MVRSTDALLADLARFCREIVDATSGLDLDDFLSDQNAVRAMERRLEMLGEIATQLGGSVPDAGVDWDGLRGLRVMLAHIYHRIMPQRLWAFAVEDVPKILGSLEP